MYSESASYELEKAKQKQKEDRMINVFVKELNREIKLDKYLVETYGLTYTIRNWKNKNGVI